ncbi:hypothetical protein HUJ04_001203 [Dendroctonus ponderosae]|nr:hypothetical protein HUJ04_001203 [Dendroctonus ponderosae]
MKRPSILILGLFNLIAICATRQPHIVVILGDDIGWNDLGFHGSSQIPTPNIDALGYNGVVLNKFYTQAICSPSRAAFLTGKYPVRFGYQGVPLSAGEDRPLPHDLELLPERLQKLGYKTHMVGKWHLSSGRKNDTPTARGFDTHFGYWNGFVGYFDYFAYQGLSADWNISETWSGLDLHHDFKPQWQYQGQYATDLFTEKSLDVLEAHNASEPLFLYLGHLAAHAGANGTELGVKNITQTDEKFGYIEDPRRRRYADVVSELDKSVGLVVKKLSDKGMLNNSIVLFLSDNGAQTIGIYENHGSNYPLKGLKFTLLEGGVRGSAVIYSPLLRKKGYINNRLMHITDLYPTFLDLAGNNVRLARESGGLPACQPPIAALSTFHLSASPRGNPKLFNNLDGQNQWSTISKDLPSHRSEVLLNIDEKNGFSGLIGQAGRYKYLNGSYMNGTYDGALGDTGRAAETPSYDLEAVLQSAVNQAIQTVPGSVSLTLERIQQLRTQLDISGCNGKRRAADLPCLGECLFDLENDPCETENLFDRKPVVGANLKRKLRRYFSQLVPSRNRKIDLNSNPKNCNGTWFPWLDADGCERV